MSLNFGVKIALTPEREFPGYSGPHPRMNAKYSLPEGGQLLGG